MSTKVGVWEPKQPLRLEVDRLRHYVTIMTKADAANLTQALTTEEIGAGAVLMQQPEEAWQAAEALDDDQLETLVRFFTLAEMQLPGWEGGKQSPVIYLVRILKRRSGFTAELRKWIKANTDNRYLPYGSVL